MDLVAQGPAMTREDASALAQLARTGDIEPLGARAFRLKNARAESSIPAWCEARRIDHALVPPGRRFADLRLLAMDMDSTLITIECIDELGDLAGRKAEIASITARAMRGEIDYVESLRQRVALLAGLEESALARVYKERLRLTPGADALLAACRRNGVRVLLVSGGFSYFTERLRARLGLYDTISNTLEVHGGRLTGSLLGKVVDAQAKAAKFRAVLRALDAPREASVAIGDGANDLPMMAEAGLSVAYRAKPLVRSKADCALNWSGLDAVLNLFE